MRSLLIQYGRKLYQAIEWVRQRRWVQIAVNVFLILFMIVFIGLYLVRDWNQLSSLKLTLNFQLLGISFLYFGINYILFCVAWHILFKAYYPRIGWWDNLLFYSYSYLMRFLPTPVWFFASRAMLYEQVGIRKRIAVVTTFLETFLHVVSGLCLYCLLLIDLHKPWTVLPFLLSLALVIFVILRPDVFQRQSVTGEKQTEGLLRSKDVAVILVLFTFTWLFAAPFYSAVIRSLVPGMPLTLGDLWRVWILSSLISYLSSYTLGGIGMLREFSMTLLLNRWVSPPIALVITVLLRVIMTLAGIFWAVIAIGIVKLFKALHRPQPISNE